MSGTAISRSPGQNGRAPSTSFSRRGPSLRATAKERPSSSSELIPDDSASIVGHWRAVSGTSKINGVSESYRERYTSKIQVTTRENHQFQARSPGKTSFDSGVEEKDSRTPSRQDGEAASKTMSRVRMEKKALRTWMACPDSEVHTHQLLLQRRGSLQSL